MDTATIMSIMTKNRVDTGRFGSQFCAFRCTHTSADPVRLLCIRLALPLTISLPSGSVLSARHTVGVSPCALWLAGFFSWDCILWYERSGRRTGQLVGPLVDTAAMTTVMREDRVDFGGLSSQCCTFRCTQKIATPIRLLYIRLALPLNTPRICPH